MKEVYDFLKKTGTYYLATLDGEQPRVRPFGTVDLFENNIYIQTGKVKAVSKQIHKNPKIEISAFDGKKWIRVEAEAIWDDNIEAERHMLDEYTSLKGMYSAGDGNTEVFKLTNMKATFQSFGGEAETLLFFGEKNVKLRKIKKESFTVIGKLASSNEGEGFVQKAWNEANSSFGEVAPLALKNKDGNLVGIWGAMSDLGHNYQPWDDGFTKGLYLAGVECPQDAEAPEGWVKWTIPGYEYLVAVNNDMNIFGEVLAYMDKNGLSLAGAAHDHNDPATGTGYIYFPIRRL